MRCIALLGVAAMMFAATPAFARQGAGAAPPAEPDQEALAKKLANPVSDLVSVPFQFNWEQNVGPDEQTRFVLNVQPVMPFSLNANWNMITRVIVPFVSQPPLFEGGAPTFGVSDILTSFSSRRRKAASSGASARQSACPRRRSRPSAPGSGAQDRLRWP